MSNPRQTRALALLAGHGATLLFMVGYYARVLEGAPAPPLMVPVFATILFLLPLTFAAIGVGVAYAALAASTEENDRNFRLLERLAVSLFGLMMFATIGGLFISVSDVLVRD